MAPVVKFDEHVIRYANRRLSRLGEVMVYYANTLRMGDDESWVTIEQVMDLLEVSHGTARRLLEKMWSTEVFEHVVSSGVVKGRIRTTSRAKKGPRYDEFLQLMVDSGVGEAKQSVVLGMGAKDENGERPGAILGDWNEELGEKAMAHAYGLCLPDAESRVYVQLARLEHGEGVILSSRRLGLMTSLYYRTAQRAIDKLESRGLITVEREVRQMPVIRVGDPDAQLRDPDAQLSDPDAQRCDPDAQLCDPLHTPENATRLDGLDRPDGREGLATSPFGERQKTQEPSGKDKALSTGEQEASDRGHGPSTSRVAAQEEDQEQDQSQHWTDEVKALVEEMAPYAQHKIPTPVLARSLMASLGLRSASARSAHESGELRPWFAENALPVLEDRYGQTPGVA